MAGLFQVGRRGIGPPWLGSCCGHEQWGPERLLLDGHDEHGRAPCFNRDGLSRTGGQTSTEFENRRGCIRRVDRDGGHACRRHPRHAAWPDHRTSRPSDRDRRGIAAQPGASAACRDRTRGCPAAGRHPGGDGSAGRRRQPAGSSVRDGGGASQARWPAAQVAARCTQYRPSL